jgi:hypothetical protein
MGKIIAHRHQILFFLLLVLTLFIPLYPKLPLASVEGTYVAIRLEDILIALVTSLWFGLNYKNVFKFLRQPITKSFILFWAVGFLSLLSAYFITHSIQPNLGFLHYLRRVETMILFFVAASTIKNIHQVKIILGAMILATLIIVFYGIGQIVWDLPVISTTNREFSKGLILTLTPGARPNSSFAGHYDLAAYLSMAIIFTSTLFFAYGFKNLLSIKGHLIPKLITLTGAVSFVMLGLTAARVSFVATLLGVILSFWVLKQKLLIGLLIVASVAMVAAIPQLRHRLVATITVNLLEGGGPKYEPDQSSINQFTPLAENADPATVALQNESTQSASKSATIASDIAPGEPTNYTELTVARSYNIRTEVEWPRALRSFYKNPLLGTGYSSLHLATDNDILRSLGEVGILGTLSLSLIFIAVIKKMLRSLNKVEKFEKLFLIATISTTVNILITGLFIDVLEASKVASLLWIMLGVAWAVACKYKFDND